MIVNIFKWFFGAIGDEHKGSMSLVRITYLTAFIIAAIHWYYVREITDFHFYFLMITLIYILFKVRGLDLISKIVDMLISSKNKIINNVVKTVEKETKDG